MFWIRRCSRPLPAFLSIILACLVSTALSTAQESAPTGLALSAHESVPQLVSRNRTRAAALPGYSTGQICQLTYHGFAGMRSGEMTLNIDDTAGSAQHYTLVSQSGSKFIIDHVLKRLQRSEQQAHSARNREVTAVTPDHYNFDLLGQKTTAQERFYVLRGRPKTDNKSLFRGQVWVDASDFAIARIVAPPEIPLFGSATRASSRITRRSDPSGGPFETDQAAKSVSSAEPRRC